MDKMTGGWQIRRYESSDAAVWDDFTARSRNATFLFNRGYMDYHSDRFADSSLVAFLRGKVMALLPADVTGDGVLRSHGGLTYGGWILPCGHIDGGDVLDLFNALTQWCRLNGIRRIDYRPVPHIYHRLPSEDDLYALFRLGARQQACAISTTIDFAAVPEFSAMQRRHLRKAQKLNVEIVEETGVAPFHSMLAQCLRERHGAVPVHTAAELAMLKERFPDNIRIFTANVSGTAHAGVCMYLSRTVAHAQYIASTPQGRENNLLTLLFDDLTRRFADGYRYFDFGISTEAGGMILNRGLLRQKTTLGGSATVYQRFILDI